MNTVTFKSVLDQVATKMGLDPAVNVLPSMAAAFATYLQTQIKNAWRSYDWPEIVLTEQRQYRPDYAAGTTYAAGAEVLGSDQVYYRSVQAANIGHALTNTAWWIPATDLDRYISLRQTGKTVIGEPLKAFRSNPATAKGACGIPFTRTVNGVQFATWCPPVIWLKFRLPAPRFSSVYYVAGATYKAGDVRFWRDTGDCYQAASAGALGEPETDAAWVIQPVPEFLEDYAVHAAYADALREDGQIDKANVEEARANGMLDDEKDQLQIQQGQTRRYKVRLGGYRR